MAALNYKTLIVADSRGAGLQRSLDELDNIGSVKVEIHRGAGLEQAVVNSREALQSFKPNLVILFAGICNITSRNSRTHITTLRYRNIDTIVDSVIAAMDRALTFLKDEGYENVSIATITGIDMRRYNNQPASQRDPYQDMLNNAIIAVNRIIIDSNKTRNTPTTWTATMVHAYYRGAYHYLYHRLYDGCHPMRSTVTYWARMMAKVIRLMKR